MRKYKIFYYTKIDIDMASISIYIIDNVGFVHCSLKGCSNDMIYTRKRVMSCNQEIQLKFKTCQAFYLSSNKLSRKCFENANKILFYWAIHNRRSALNTEREMNFIFFVGIIRNNCIVTV